MHTPLNFVNFRVKTNALNFNYFIILFTCFFLLNCRSINEPTIKEGNDVSKKDSLDYPGPPDNETPEEGSEKSDEEKGDIVKGDTIKVKLEADDSMLFNRKEIRVKEGQIVELTLTHTGKLSKDAMGHNFVLLKQGTNIRSFIENLGRRFSYRDVEILGQREEVITYTSFVGRGESTKVIFDAPLKGSYDFICAFPGHYQPMNGKFIVE